VRVVIYEQQHSGHFYQCVSPLLAPLCEMAAEVTVAITPAGLASQQYRDFLEPWLSGLGNVTVWPRVPEARPGMRWKDRVHEHRVFRRTIRELRADYVLAPSADVQTTAMGLWRLAGLGALPRGLRGEGAMHCGPGAGGGAKLTLKRFVYRATHAMSGWDRVHYINPLQYEDVARGGGGMAKRAAALPYPVKPAERLDQERCRRRLGVPVDGRLLVAPGYLDRRKGIAQLLGAFGEIARDPELGDVRLLLAGAMDAPYRSLLEREHSGLVRGGRVIAMGRYLDDDEFAAAISAADVVCAPYPGFDGVSSIALIGAAAGKPVVTDRSGWCGAAVERFGLGWSCDVNDPGSFSGALARAARECDSFSHDERAQRLLEFHRPENYAESLLGSLRSVCGRPPSRTLRTWEWACGRAAARDRGTALAHPAAAAAV
jgi:glycosyltransferase involved in cell wall biosynthesis